MTGATDRGRATPRGRWVRLGLIAGVVLGVALKAALHPAPVVPKAPPEKDHRALFDELVKDEPADRQRAKDDFPVQPWSRLDGFGAFEGGRFERIAGAHGFTKQQLYLVLDEGLRRHWPGPDGGVLDVATVPLSPRPMD